MKRFIFYIIMILSIVLFNQSQSLLAQTAGYKVTGNIIIGGGVKWDYLSIQKSSNRLFVSHDTEVVVINLDSNKVIGRIGGLKGVHGIAFASKIGKGFISESKNNSVLIFDLNSLQTIREIKTTGDDPDAIVYDPFTERIFTSNGKSTNSTAIDAKTGEIAGTVKLSGSAESSVSDSKGRMFFNIENENEINVIDPKTLTLIDKWKTSPCEQPTAIAMDKKNNRIFVGGRNQTLAVIDAGSGKVISTFPIGKGVDACAYDSETHLIFCSNKDATITVIEQDSADKYELVGHIATLPGAKTIALDVNTHRIYSSTMVNVENDKQSFGVLIIDKK